MDCFGFNVSDWDYEPFEGGDVLVGDCWHGPLGNVSCQIMAAANLALRNKQIEQIKTYNNKFDKIDALIEIMTDCDYDYDYDVVFGNKDNGIQRKKHYAKIGPLEYHTPSVTLREGFYDPDGGYDLNGKRKRQSPTYWILGRGQCVTTANEVCRVLRANEIPCDMISSPSHCLNVYEKELQIIPHVYNRIHLPNGKTTTIDICANQMQRDAERLNLDIDYNLLHEKDGDGRLFTL